METGSETPRVGDALVRERADGRCEVLKMDDAGDWQTIRTGLKDRGTAHGIARALLESGGRIWYQHENDRSITRY